MGFAGGLATNGQSGGGGGSSFSQGTNASRPAASPNALYFATDTGELWIANAAGSAWQSIAKTSASSFAASAISLPAFGNTIAWPQAAISEPGAAGLNITGYLDLITAGAGLQVKEGSNAKQGTATLTAGSVVVANTSVTATSRIFLTSQADGGTPGFLRVSARTAGTSFTITSSSGTDTSTVAYEIFEPG